MSRRPGETPGEYQQRCLLEFEAECMPGIHALRGKYAKSQSRVISEEERERLLAPAACRCGATGAFQPWPTGDALDRFTALRCCQCGRLLYISKDSGCKMWYKKEAEHT